MIRMRLMAIAASVPALIASGAVSAAAAGPNGGSAQVAQPTGFAVSPPLQNGPQPTVSPDRPPHEQPQKIPNAGASAAQGGPDGAAQTATQNVATASSTPAPGLNFAGVGSATGAYNSTPCNCAPSDANLAVGATQVVQWVNTSIAVYNKSTGAIASGFPKLGNWVFSNLANGCATNNDGDPVVKYDQVAQRWILTQFSVSTTPYLDCIAVSTSSDATGTYNTWSYSFGSQFPDYPKFSVWPASGTDAYFATYNLYLNGSSFTGADACAYDREAMLSGAANPNKVCFTQSSSVASLLPADLDGGAGVVGSTLLPPSGEPGYFMNFGANVLNLWQLHTDWATPSSSTFSSSPTAITTASFSEACSGGTCIAQPSTRQKLDSLADRLMYRVAYRNFGDHESLVLTHSVSGPSSTAAPRWYELRQTTNAPGGTYVGSNWSINQQSTYAPDATYRWMGSAAMDKVGDLAVGYSASSSSLYPSIYYAARSVNDTLNTLQPEVQLKAGAGSQSTNGVKLNRWGDYASMAVDPSDDCTFWYTNQYLKATSTYNWSTWIGSFVFPGCTATSPAVPTNLTATAASASQVQLGWNASSGASSYTVQRSSDGTTFSTVASGLSGTSYLDGQYLRLNGSSFDVSTPSSAALAITGDLDIRVQAALDNWASAVQVLAAKDGSPRSYDLYVAPGGQLTLFWSPDGSNTNGSWLSSTAAPGFANGSTHWVRVTRSASTGTVIFYTSADGTTWTQLGSAVSGPAGSIFAGSQPLSVGSLNGGGYYASGDIDYVEVRSGIGGTVVANPDFTIASGTTFSDGSGNAWTISGSGASLPGGPPLAPSTTYTYRVQAVSAGGSSPYSTPATATTLA